MHYAVFIRHQQLTTQATLLLYNYAEWPSKEKGFWVVEKAVQVGTLKLMHFSKMNGLLTSSFRISYVK